MYLWGVGQISDQSGTVIVVEYVGGKKQVYDNPLGVLTNSPPFDWQLINVGNYVNLSPISVPKMQLSNFTVRNYGQGSGALGIPGDYTPLKRTFEIDDNTTNAQILK